MNNAIAEEMLQYDLITGLIVFLLGLILFPLFSYWLYRFAKRTWWDDINLPDPCCIFLLVPVIISLAMLFSGGEKVLRVMIAPSTYLQEHLDADFSKD